MLRSFTKSNSLRLLKSTYIRPLTTTRVLQKEVDKEADAWEQVNVDRSSILNNATPQTVANNAVPNSMLAAFSNMFDRGPNVGIEVITKHGFVLSNHIKIDQPLILVNGSPFLWNAPPRSEGLIPMKDWDLEAFKIFELVSPRPELIMFGTGRDFAPIPEHVRQFFFKLGIQVDQMNSVSVQSVISMGFILIFLYRNMQQQHIMYWLKKEEE